MVSYTGHWLFLETDDMNIVPQTLKMGGPFYQMDAFTVTKITNNHVLGNGFQNTKIPKSVNMVYAMPSGGKHTLGNVYA